MAAITSTVGLVSGAMGIWQFVADQIPSKEEDQSKYRIIIGLNGYNGTVGGEKLSAAEGDIGLVKLYNKNHDLMGSGMGGDIGFNSHQYGDIGIDQDGSQQSTWTEFSAGDDGICIAAITATMPEGSKWGWTGDWGYLCGMDWFYSGYDIQNAKGIKDVSPKCVWIDNDHSNDIKTAVIGINWSALHSENEDTNVPDKATAKEQCGVNMQAWRNWNTEQLLPLPESKDRRRRDGGNDNLQRRSQRSDDRLIVSKLAHQNATELCAATNSFGPDFVSEEEGVYCNMETHETAPLCQKDNKAPECFDYTHAEGPAMVRRNGKRSLRNPTQVITWGGDKGANAWL